MTDFHTPKGTGYNWQTTSSPQNYAKPIHFTPIPFSTLLRARQRNYGGKVGKGKEEEEEESLEGCLEGAKTTHRAQPLHTAKQRN